MKRFSILGIIFFLVSPLSFSETESSAKVSNKPDCFEDIIALLAMYRPGPLESGMVDDFVKRKHGTMELKFDLPQLENILKETQGVILYQEQVMKIASVLAGFSLGVSGYNNLQA